MIGLGCTDCTTPTLTKMRSTLTMPKRVFGGVTSAGCYIKVRAHAEIARCTKDISSDPFYQFLQNYFLPMQIVFGVLLYLAAGWPFVVWVIFVRLVLVYHCTWFVNSATHKFGYRTYETNDSSTNCWWVAVLTYGEGWHNNHHAYQYSARHGMEKWEIDFTWMTIQVLEALGLASKVKLPAK